MRRTLQGHRSTRSVSRTVICAFVLALCASSPVMADALKPHRDLLYNIARAYLDLGRIPEALDYFRRYVATNPPDRSRVDEVIARLSTATAPQPAATPPAPSVD